MPEITTRDFRPQDAQPLAELLRAAILETGRVAYDAAQCVAWASAADDAEAWAQRLGDAWVRVAVTPDDVPVGFAAILLPGHIDLLYTSPAHARQGIASLLLEDLFELAAAMGAHSIDTIASEVARPLFEKQGFVVAESLNRERSGHTLACYRMVRDARRA